MNAPPVMLAPLWPPADRDYTHSPVTAQVIERARSTRFDTWWSRVASVGYCARPVHLSGRDHAGRPVAAMGRCKNRRAAVCPSCSDLYAGDTWHLVHAGVTGEATLNLPNTIAGHPMVFATLTAPSFGPVHTIRRGTTGGARRCHNQAIGRYCKHGQPLWCTTVHTDTDTDTDTDTEVGQPLCAECYDYQGHVLFSWHAPALWQRFTIALRRLLARHLTASGADPKAVRLGYVKIVEMQARAIPHLHTVIRLDDATIPTHLPPAPPSVAVTAADLAALIVRAAHDAHLSVPAGDEHSRVLKFGEQLDVQPITPTQASTGPAAAEGAASWSARRVAGYLAKYVTKSVAEFGLGNHRMSPLAIDTLDVTEHVRRILRTIATLAEHPVYAELISRLHSLGYRGHITTKSRRYSTTMGVLRARRHTWRAQQSQKHECRNGDIARPDNAADGELLDAAPMTWEFLDCGHRSDGERLLAITAALRAREQRHTARDALTELRAQAEAP